MSVGDSVLMLDDLRFAVAISQDLAASPAEQARTAERLGFDVAIVGDHIGPELSPLLVLATAAAATTRIRLGTQVINADLRTPVQLAWDALSLDRLSNGRFELGLGAGHTPNEYDAIGVEMRPARQRKRRLMEFIEITRQLLDGDTVTHKGEHFQLNNARVGEPVADRIPIFVGGNGEELLEYAGRHADIVGLQGLGRTLPDGHRHQVNWTVDHLERQLEQIRSGTDGRPVELNALVQIVKLTDDRQAEIEAICQRVEGLRPRDAEQSPYLLIGTVEEIACQIRDAHHHWEITYFTVRDADAFAPVLRALRFHA